MHYTDDTNNNNITHIFYIKLIPLILLKNDQNDDNIIISIIVSAPASRSEITIFIHKQKYFKMICVFYVPFINFNVSGYSR